MMMIVICIMILMIMFMMMAIPFSDDFDDLWLMSVDVDDSIGFLSKEVHNLVTHYDYHNRH